MMSCNIKWMQRVTEKEYQVLEEYEKCVRELLIQGVPIEAIFQQLELILDENQSACISLKTKVFTLNSDAPTTKKGSFTPFQREKFVNLVFRFEYFQSIE